LGLRLGPRLGPGAQGSFRGVFLLHRVAMPARAGILLVRVIPNILRVHRSVNLPEMPWTGLPSIPDDHACRITPSENFGMSSSLTMRVRNIRNSPTQNQEFPDRRISPSVYALPALIIGSAKSFSDLS